ncbi:unnamed protein product [Blepharisma stoltei]|uniref:MutS-like protein n=1 Tax=Blepharisma stoltei TaxID=1481888 RepID=A0AAU9JC32_9CILI|nr:unnamed protein product [Blepharisma stoltei]
MKIYSELIKRIEEGKSLEKVAKNLKPKLVHLIEINKQEIDLLKQQEILLQIACNHYNELAYNFPDRVGFLNDISRIDMHEIYSYSRLPILVRMVAEGISILLNEKERWNIFYKNLNYDGLSVLLDVEYDQLSKQILYDLGTIVNTNRNNINTIYMISVAAARLFHFLLTTYDWAITIRDNFPQFSNFKDIDRLVRKEIFEYSNLEAVRNKIKNKEIELDLLIQLDLKLFNLF